eukprot:9335532-Alexandrium_andersonii.AAC.1
MSDGTLVPAERAARVEAQLRALARERSGGILRLLPLEPWGVAALSGPRASPKANREQAGAASQ